MRGGGKVRGRGVRGGGERGGGGGEGEAREVQLRSRSATRSEKGVGGGVRACERGVCV